MSRREWSCWSGAVWPWLVTVIIGWPVKLHSYFWSSCKNSAVAASTVGVIFYLLLNCDVDVHIRLCYVFQHTSYLLGMVVNFAVYSLSTRTNDT